MRIELEIRKILLAERCFKFCERKRPLLVFLGDRKVSAKGLSSFATTTRIEESSFKFNSDHQIAPIKFPVGQPSCLAKWTRSPSTPKVINHSIFSISPEDELEPPPPLLVNSRRRNCFLCFMRRFWNQVLTCVSLRPKAEANSTRSGVDKYLCVLE